jgi:UDP-N-acetylmuramoyl-tripeptide--D-alanyl-D-alanine ligase
VTVQGGLVQVTEMSREGTELVATVAGTERQLSTPGLHPLLAQMVSEELAAKREITDDDLLRSVRRADAFRLQRLPGLDGRLIDAGSDSPTGDTLVGWGKLLARVADPAGKTVLVCGGVNLQPDSDYDTLGGLAASLIRLRVGLFIGVGRAVKALATQVGLEGSWDGESVWAEDGSGAYDYLCDGVGPSDIVALVGLSEDHRGELFGRLGGELT